MERRADGLQIELQDLIRDVRTLRADLISDSKLPGNADYADLKRKARIVAEELEHLEIGETDLIQVSITQDIGAGD